MAVSLEARDLSKTYTGKNIVKRVTKTFDQGIHVIRGKSGSGKSTLLSLLGGMETPTTGKVIFQGQSFYEQSEKEQAKVRGTFFGFIFQSFHLIPELSVYENILLPLQFTNDYKKERNIHSLAVDLGIDQKLNMYPLSLSGGEQQRVAIARAMITEPKVIFADEPTGNLDRKSSEMVEQKMRQLCNDLNQTLIMVTHDQSIFQKDVHSYWMEDGYIQEVSP
ncbi:ABC transporter ATP-binding protein [Halalkalibacterium halodurans]|jgi:putative ABC transport system ATP-binding protein|uniref:ABC transporter domain-containing protein n=1 Tax=Halalkalibacterium halodurans TaxID=86665 RepID=A0A0M0KMD5_ALKHA|nr:ABC transporter ATP-binding protein [Halalkalibacterium halodurans]TPE67872.1 ABC transporter ATP-binding protein [Halalkalibacterium halodurans]